MRSRWKMRRNDERELHIHTYSVIKRISLYSKKVGKALYSDEITHTYTPSLCKWIPKQDFCKKRRKPFICYSLCKMTENEDIWVHRQNVYEITNVCEWRKLIIHKTPYVLKCREKYFLTFTIGHCEMKE